jgi:hypothetical protein
MVPAMPLFLRSSSVRKNFSSAARIMVFINIPKDILSVTVFQMDCPVTFVEVAV